MKDILLEQTNFNGLKELIMIMASEHPLVLLFGDSERTYVEFTTTEFATRYRFWWNKSENRWEVTRLESNKSPTEPKPL
jgi:hypothetical protein